MTFKVESQSNPRLSEVIYYQFVKTILQFKDETTIFVLKRCNDLQGDPNVIQNLIAKKSKKD